MYRNFNLFPFQQTGIYSISTYFLIDQFGLALRSTYSMLIAIALKTFLTSAVKVLIWLIATTTKICTNVWSRKDHSFSPSYHMFLTNTNNNTSHQPTQITFHYSLFKSWLFGFLYVYTISAPLIFMTISFVR